MVSTVRSNYNGNFSKEKYEAFLKELNSLHPGAIEFRVAETPVFVTKDFTTPCGACRQVLAEFNSNKYVILVNLTGELKLFSLDSLAGHCYTASNSRLPTIQEPSPCQDSHYIGNLEKLPLLPIPEWAVLVKPQPCPNKHCL